MFDLLYDELCDLNETIIIVIDEIDSIRRMTTFCTSFHAHGKTGTLRTSGSLSSVSATIWNFGIIFLRKSRIRCTIQR